MTQNLQKSFIIEDVYSFGSFLDNKLNFLFLGVVQLFCDVSESYDKVTVK